MTVMGGVSGDPDWPGDADPGPFSIGIVQPVDDCQIACRSRSGVIRNPEAGSFTVMAGGRWVQVK